MTLTFLYYTAFLMYVLLIARLYVGNRAAVLSRLSMAILALLALWSFSDAFLVFPGTDHDSAVFWLNVNSIPGVFVPAFVLWFSHAFARKNIFRHYPYSLLFMAPPAVFVCLQWTGRFIPDVVPSPFGWLPGPVSPVVAWWFTPYAVMYFLSSLVVMRRYGLGAPRMIERKQARILVITCSVYLIGVFSIYALFLSGVRLPNFTAFIGLVWALGLVYAVSKYEFLAITPVSAASNIISTMSDGVVLLDDECALVDCNQAFLSLSGYARGELVGHRLNSLLKHLDGMGGCPGTIERKDSETTLVTKTGAMMPVSFSCAAIRDGSGRTTGRVLIFRDVTERKAMERRLLAQARLAGIGRLSAGVAHELNNPLTALISYVDLVQESAGGRLADRERTRLAAAKEAGLRMRGIISDLLDYHHPGIGGRVPGDINELVRGSVSHCMSLLNGVTVEIDPGDVPVIFVNPDRIMQVFVNLLTNSADALRGRETPRVSIATAHDRDYGGVVVRVRDNGRGIAPAVLSSIFDPFFTTKETGRGTGLGLSIVKRIIEEHRGSITVASEPGRFTEFTVILPAVSQ